MHHTAPHNGSRTLGVLILALLVPGFALGLTEALSVLPESGKAMAMVGGRFATIDDPSAARTSPANILLIDGDELMVNFGFWRANVDYESFDGEKIALKEPNRYLSSIFYVKSIEANEDGSGSKQAWGLGIHIPSGIGFKYPRESRWKYVLPFESEIANLAVSPVYAFQATEKLSVGIGLDLVYSTLNTKQDFPWAAVTMSPTPDGVMDFEASGFGWGGFIGATLQMTDHQRVSLIGRLPVEVDYDGDLKISNFPAALEGSGLAAESDFKSEIDFAGAVSAGYAVDINDDVTIGLDFEYANSSTHNEIPADFGANQALLGGATGNILDWEDNWSAGIGGEWRKTEDLSLRGGYHYTDTALIERTFTPAVATNNRHIFSAGAGLNFGDDDQHTVDFAYSYVRMEDWTVDENQQPAFLGDYTFEWNIATVSYRYHF